MVFYSWIKIVLKQIKAKVKNPLKTEWISERVT